MMTQIKGFWQEFLSPSFLAPWWPEVWVWVRSQSYTLNNWLWLAGGQRLSRHWKYKPFEEWGTRFWAQVDWMECSKPSCSKTEGPFITFYSPPFSFQLCSCTSIMHTLVCYLHTKRSCTLQNWSNTDSSSQKVSAITMIVSFTFCLSSLYCVWKTAHQYITVLEPNSWTPYWFSPKTRQEDAQD